MVIGEIVDVGTTRFTAQCIERENPPHFGSFIKTDGRETSIFGLVYGVQETSIDPSRRPIALGLSPERLRKEYPHLDEYLKIEFEAAVIGFSDSDRIRTYLPPFPPRIHSFVHQCDTAEVLGLTEDLEFIRTVNSLNAIPIEELIAAAIRLACLERNNGQSFLIRAGQEVARLLKDDYEKAGSILRRINYGG